VFVLLTPLSHWHYIAMSSPPSFVWVVVVGLEFTTVFFWPALTLWHPLWIVVFAVLGGAALKKGSLGVIAGLWSKELTRWRRSNHHADDVPERRFLLDSFLPPVWQKSAMPIRSSRWFQLALASNVSPWLSLAIVGSALAVVSTIAVNMLRGYHRHWIY
jgi:ABC-2 type transport system permease protein